MKISIIKPDGIVGINGVFIKLDLSSLPEGLRIVQWIDDHGFEEWTDRDQVQITNLVAYASILGAWQAAKLEIDARAADPYYYGMTPEEKAAAIAAAARVMAIEAEQKADRFHEMSPQEMKDLIESLFAAADTAAKTKELTKNLIKRLALYIIR